LRLGRPDEAVDVVSGAFIAHGTLDASLTARMLLGQACVRLGQPERGLSILEAAQRDAAGAHPTIRSEIALNGGLAYYRLRRLDDAEAALDRVIPEADIVHARSLEYRGWVAIARADYAAATEHFTAVLRRLDTCRRYDRFLEATAIQELAIFAAERFDRAAWLFAEPRAERLDWSAPGLANPRHVTALAVSMLYEADGRVRDALRWTRVAEDVALGAGRALLAMCRRAAILRAAGERLAHADLVAAMRREFALLNAAALQGEERALPLALAEEVAYAGDVVGARALVHRHDELPVPARALVTGDPREAAYRSFVEAVIADAGGDHRVAHARYQRAFHTFRRLGYERRAVLAAQRLAELTGQPYLRDYIDAALRKVAAHSPLRRRAEC
jgi:tetratricopeptide (TPR) repeat protein